ncbi:MAG: histidinol-phosphate transaminase [Gammaproteobacteria bacterium]|jgi:histidinol-phosphate aminotransferase|nr:histidinol-phosphate transaminase [Gammaproteobacteria bacterium]MBT5203918.1 histidinol-phosphate transaminase [Gammaproteobacteria bacterium]MBT5602143.1 histidinol-phosphate transaminase [Gammaproteobacteria bacterium]MBT6243935.1 histidinol-phosphate transaminase [Gammaproteobacteria bacterium]
MSKDIVATANKAITHLQPYLPGKPTDELERELGLSRITKLASNENPLGPSEKISAGLGQVIQELTRYPDGSAYHLKQRLSEVHEVEMDQITLGNGSNDVLELVARVFLGPGAEAIVAQHSFVVFSLVARALDSQLKIIPAVNYGQDLSATLAAVTPQTKMIFIANPNNPTGTWLTGKAITSFLDRLPEHVVVVLDQAYFEYVDESDYPDGIKLSRHYPNLVVTRTFSKAYGLAALRLGYAVSQPDIADLMNRIRQPFNVNQVALAAAMIALDDQDYVERSVQLNRSGMAQMIAMMSELGLPVIPSVGNFICIDFGQEAGPIYEGLLRQGVIVRPVGLYELPNFLRVTIGTQDENQHFFDALKAVLIK